MELKNKIGQEVLLFDGAMGTMLQKRGLPTGGLPELYNLTHPEVVLEIHKEYVAAGADIITTNTFQANPLKIPAEYEIETIIDAGVQLAKQSGARYVAADVGPLGHMLEPLGTVSFDEAYDYFRRQVVQAEKSGADCVIMETLSDQLEAKIAILATKENTNLPILCTLTYQEDGRTFMGCDPVTATLTLQDLGISAIGVNCSLGPKELQSTVDSILKVATIPVMVQANAGLPVMKGEETVYHISPDEFTEYVTEMVEKGVSIIGGCCGTTPEFIAKLKDSCKGKSVVHRNIKPITATTSGTKTVFFDQGVTVIGERINPTGKKKLKEALLHSKMDYIIGEAIDQSDAGSDMLDVNVGLPDIDEAAMQKRVVKEIQTVTNLPLQIDSSDPEAIEAGVRVYNGKPLINSVNGKQDNMDAIFPIVQKYGALVIGLTLDENGIPETAEGRYEIAEKIVKEAEKYQIPKEHILIDCLVLTASAQQEQVMETLKAIQLVKARLGVKTVLGVSNVSFGLPSRPLLNATFLAAAFGAGLDAPILNPLSKEYMNVVDAFRVLNNQDRDATQYIETHGQTIESKTITTNTSTLDLKEIIIQGRKDESAPKVTQLLLEGVQPLDIVNQYFVPALDCVGEGFEKGTLFLPQLMQSAEAVKSGFVVIKNHMDALGEKQTYKGKILIATVKGDIHDIGKNIVSMILENYGYEVYDMGKDVPIEDIVNKVIAEEIPLVGLSALMTTTVKSMKETISAIRGSGHQCKIMVGGAVLNEDYAEFVGADYFAKDAMESVAIAENFFADR